VQSLFDHHQPAIILLFRVMNRYVGNWASMPDVFPDCPACVFVRNTDICCEMVRVSDWPEPTGPDGFDSAFTD
jgi:hypothetical protein